MPYSPLVSKIRVYNPNKKGAAAANRNGVIYIATRPGVSLETENQDYLRYIAKRPRSHGLFGNIDTEDLKEVSENIYDMTKNGKIIYKGIISLSEKDAEELGFRNANAWNNYLTRVMPDIAEELQISSNYTWVAAFHAEEKHPHVHYMLWDNTDKVKSPFIHKSVQQKIRINLEEEMFDDAYNQGIKQALAQEFDELNRIRNEERENILGETKNIMSEAVGYAPGMECERLPVRCSETYMKELTEKIEKLLEVLPGKGAFKYAYLPPEAKQQLWKIVDTILQKSDINNSKENYLKQVENNGRLLGLTKTKIKAEIRKASDDINRRIANKVLKEVKQTYFFDREATEPSSVQENFENQKEPENFPEIDEKQWENWMMNAGDSGEFEEDEIWTEPSSVQEYFEHLEETEKIPQIDEKQWVNEENCRELMDNRVQVAQASGVSGELYVEWNNEYKMAMKYIYNETPDFNRSFELLKQEADKGNVLAMIEVSKLITKELVEADAEVGQYYAQSGFHGLVQIYQRYENSDNKKDIYMKEYAAYRLGKYYMYATEPVEETDYEKAKSYLTQAPNNKYALYSLGKLYQEEKIFVTEEHKKEENLRMAKALYHRAVDELKSPNPYAAYELGKIYEKEADDTNSSLYYQKAFEKFSEMVSNNTDDNLYYRLGSMCIMGKGTEVDEVKGEEYFLKAAELNNVYAKLKMSGIYEKRGELEKAIDMIRDIAEPPTSNERNEKLSEEKTEKQQGNNQAQYKLGCIYANDDNPDYYDLEKAIKYFEKAAAQDNEYAQYKLGCIYADKENEEIYDIEKAIEYLEKSEVQDNEYAQYKLGCIYADKESEGIYDIGKALEYLEKSTVQDNEYAQYKLGCIYADKENEGIYDLRKAIEYLEKSVSRDNEYAQYKLGSIYADKENKEIYDLGKAIEYLEKSEAQDNEYAQYKLGCIYANKENEKIYDIRKAMEYLEKSETQGNEYAQYKLGCIYADKENEEIYDLEKAIEYLEKSEARDNEYAQYKLGGLYADKDNEKIYDIRKALEYLKKSEAQDNEYAQYKLGCLHLDATIPEHYDVHKAINYLQMAACQDNVYAQCKLGCIYYFGKYGVQDKMIGKYWLDKAVENGSVFAKNILEFHQDMVPLGFSYCLLKGALTSIETLGRDVTAQNAEFARSHSKQAMREKHLHKDNSQDMDY